jgi:hypothetical protein
MISILSGFYLSGALLSARVNFISIGVSYLSIARKSAFSRKKRSSILLFIMLCSQFVLTTCLWFLSIRKYLSVWTMSAKEISDMVDKIHNN